MAGPERPLRMSLALKLALAPLLLAQAVHTRRRLPRLPEAAGAREGVVGRGAELDLLIVGDSSAAGVGVDTQDDALAGCLSRALARHAGRRVRWRLVARSGVTSAGALALLDEQPPRPAELAVVVTGVNDVIDQVAPRRALPARTALMRALRERSGVRHAVFTPLPPMHRFAGLPQPLRWVVGRDAFAHGRALALWAQTQRDASLVQMDLPLDPAMLAADGFHPGAPVYRLWGDALAAHIVRHVLPQPEFASQTSTGETG
ncbi:MAG: SGNH/GDSL hydrolase family protein [Aquabacterium sp.]|jgi:lysophospholipase L1-like esterase|nr:SGNH/GDSL hydrolase family protein [Aquabacterium sp.]